MNDADVFSQTLTQKIETQHKDLFQCFLFFQEALMLNDRAVIAESWQAFHQGLLLHIKFEDECLFSQQYFSDEQWQWRCLVYQKEHQKIIKLLEGLDHKINHFLQLDKERALAQFPQSSWSRVQRLMILALIEQSIQLRHVLEHHEEREEKDALIFIQEELNAQQKTEAFDLQLQQAFNQTLRLDKDRNALIEKLKLRFNQ